MWSKSVSTVAGKWVAPEQNYVTKSVERLLDGQVVRQNLPEEEAGSLDDGTADSLQHGVSSSQHGAGR